MNFKDLVVLYFIASLTNCLCEGEKNIVMNYFTLSFEMPMSMARVVFTIHTTREKAGHGSATFCFKLSVNLN